MKERISVMLACVSTTSKGVWAGHRNVSVAVSAIAVMGVLATGLLISIKPSATAQPSATPGATESTTASPSPSDASTPLPSPPDTPAASMTPEEFVYSDLDGVQAPSNLAHRLPVAVMIDDNAVARPQSGFSSASIVYQAPADGGEDRYMLIFQEGTATDIGPVRSARPYYVYWVAEYRAEFAHVGGDVSSLQQVIPAMSGNIYNMDALSGGSCAYHRIATRAAPHNDYTNSAALISCAANLKYPTTYQNLPTRPFVDDTPLAQLPATQTISIPYRTGTVGYKFDRTTDSYLRLVDGSLQADPANNKQVVAGSVIVMYQAVSYFDNSAIEPGHNSRPIVANVGSGKAVVFEEGKAINATWKKTSNTALTRFYDSSGKEIPLVRGEIFMQVVPIGTAVTVK